MLKKKNHEPDLKHWLKEIHGLLERLVVCQEKKLSGEVIKDFNSKEFIKKGGSDA